MAARIEARRDQRGTCEGPQKSDFPRRKNVFFPMAGMDRSTLISQIKKKETILSMSFLVRLAFLNRDVSPAMGAACPGATAAKMNSTASGLFRTQSRPKGGPSPGCGSSKRAGFFGSAHCISLEWGAAARKLSHGRLKTSAWSWAGWEQPVLCYH